MADGTSKSYGFSMDPPALPGSSRRSSFGAARQDAKLVTLGHFLALILLSLAVVPPALSGLELEPLSLISRLLLALLFGAVLVMLTLSFLAAVGRASVGSEE